MYREGARIRGEGRRGEVEKGNEERQEEGNEERQEEERGTDGRARVLHMVVQKWMTFTGSMRILRLSITIFCGTTKTTTSGRRWEGEEMGGGRRWEEGGDGRREEMRGRKRWEEGGDGRREEMGGGRR